LQPTVRARRCIGRSRAGRHAPPAPGTRRSLPSHPMADALESLKSRLADVHALNALKLLLAWDQRTMMPPAGGGHRAQHIGLLERLAHGRLVDPEVGRLLDELAALEESLDPASDDAALIRL